MKETNETGRIDLGKDPIGSLLFKMGLPSIVAMLVMSLYNVVDTFWIAKISPQAIAALTICFPIQMIFGALGVGTGVGAGSFSSRMFGAGKDTKAHQTAGQVIFLSIFFGLFIVMCGLLFHDPILRFFGATPGILPLSRTYLIVIIYGTPFLFFMMTTDYLFRSEGNPTVPMYVITTSALLNAVLDPFLIFGWGPFPELGIRGAALATVIAQGVTSLLSVYFLFCAHSKYRIQWKYTIPTLKIIIAIYRVGVPTLVTHLVFSLVLTVYNQKLGTYGPLAIATHGLGFRINGILMMALFGLGHGVMPLVGFNYGAANYERLKEIVSTAVGYAALIGGISTILIEIFARPLLTLFSSDAELLAIAVPAFRIFVVAQVLTGPTVVWINMFNGLGKGTTSMVLMIIRQVVFLIPLIYLLPVFFGLNGVWMAQPISNVVVFFIIYYWTKREYGLLNR